MRAIEITSECVKFQKEIINFMKSYSNKNLNQYDEPTKIAINNITLEFLLGNVHINNIELGMYDINEVNKIFSKILDFIKDKLNRRKK